MNRFTILLALLAAPLVLAHADGPGASDDATAFAPSRLTTPTPYSAPLSVPSAAGQISVPRIPAPSISVNPPAPPAFSSSCDSAGCWGSDGTRYNASGGALLRPDGRACQSVAGVLQCQ